MRQNIIQHYSMNTVGVQPADFVIAPDVTGFDMSEFTRADEMATIAESTTRATINELRKLPRATRSKAVSPPDVGAAAVFETVTSC